MFDLIGKRNYFFGFSILIILIGITGLVINGGFTTDIQFRGGTILEFKMNDAEFNTDKASEIITNITQMKPSIQKSQSVEAKDQSKSIHKMVVNVETLTNDQVDSISKEIIKDYSLAEDALITTQTVAPFIGNEIKVNGVKAVVISSILIILYIWIRFKIMSGLSAGVMAVIGLLHDVAIMLSVYALFKIPLNESFIAAVLTILGYSMNDTIIIYDRIRENSNLLRKVPVDELVNTSIMQTLARSINTVVTVLICVVTLFIFSVIYKIGSLEEFTLPLIVGIASGCYSSIFIASPLWVMWRQHQGRKREVAKAQA